MNEDLKIIKKKYGEKMSHLCRELFPTLLETKGLLPELLMSHFDASHFLYHDLVENELIDDFKDFILSLVELSNSEKIDTGKTPEELMLEANYILKECKTEEEIQSYKKYYAPGEELCTFSGNRLNRCHVFFAVKKDVDTIQREDFKNPKRQDLYGTSVISIQFDRDPSHLLSIKNRYNHKVDNCDATFSNNLEKIIPGLTKSFENIYGLKSEFNYDFDIVDHGYVLGNDGKYYKYNYEMNQIHYCPDNIIIDHGEVKRLDKSRYIVLDYFVLDLMEKRIFTYDSDLEDGFINTIEEIEKISIEMIEGTKQIKIIPKEGEPILITLDETNRIIGYKNNNVETIKDNFLKRNQVLKNIEMDNVLEIGNDFCTENTGLLEVSFKKCKKLGSDFLNSNEILKSINLDSVENIEDGCLFSNKAITTLNLPMVKSIKSGFLTHDEKLLEFHAPLLSELGMSSFRECNQLKILDCPNIEVIGTSVLKNNQGITELELPKVRIIGSLFMKFNTECCSFKANNLKEVGNDFFMCNEKMDILEVENLEKVGDNFLYGNRAIPAIILNKLNILKNGFMHSDSNLRMALLPNVTTIGKDVFTECTELQELSLPNVTTIGDYFMTHAIKLERFYANLLESVGLNFMRMNTVLYDFQAEKLKQSRLGFLTANERFNDYLERKNKGKTA